MDPWFSDSVGMESIPENQGSIPILSDNQGSIVWIRGYQIV